MNKKFLVGVFSLIFVGFSNLDASVQKFLKGFFNPSVGNELPYPIIRDMAATLSREKMLLISALQGEKQAKLVPLHVSKGQSFDELDQENSLCDDFSSIVPPIEAAASMNPSFMNVKHSPEGISLIPFSPVQPVNNVSSLQMHVVRSVPTYLNYIDQKEMMIQSDNDEWREMAKKRKAAFRSGNFRK